jgi:hypothetical protein
MPKRAKRNKHRAKQREKRRAKQRRFDYSDAGFLVPIGED